jgi:hypothetical protein
MQEDAVVENGQQGVLVFPALDPAAGGVEAARWDVATGLLTPAARSWRHKPVVVDGRARVDVSGRKNGVDLVVERANGWRSAAVPLLEVTGTAAVGQSIELLRALITEVDRRRPSGADQALALLQAQVRYLQNDGGPVQSSPLAAKVAGGLERIAKLGLQ